MTGFPYKYLALIVLGILIGVLPTRCHYVGQIAKKETAAVTAVNKQLSEALQKVQEQSVKNQELKTALEQSAAKHQTQLKENQDENTTLRSQLAATNKLRLKGTTCPTRPAPFDPSAGSLVNDAPVMLSAETGHAVFDLRADLISDRQQVLYLQDYIRRLTAWIEQTYGVKPPPK